jgi:alpha-1,2-mannosyltransferase
VSTPPSAARATPAAPAVGKLRAAFVAQGALIGASLATYALVLLQAGQHQDFEAYLAAARSILQGHPLYAAFLQHPFPDPTLRPAYIYPPIFAVMIAPWGWLPVGMGALGWLLLGQAALVASMVTVLRWLRPNAWACAGIVAATATFYPLWVDAVQGQANLPILLLVTLGMVGVLQHRSRFGAFIGMAVALKLTPAILLIWLLLDRRFKAAAWMLAGFAGLTGVGALLRFQDTLVFFGKVVPALASGTAVYANQSLAGMINRFFSTNPYTDPWVTLPWVNLVAIATATAMVAWWFWATRDRPAVTRAGAFLPLLPLLSSVTWPHHLVIVLPVIWLGLIAIANHEWPIAPTGYLVGVLVLFDVVSRWSAGPAFNQPGFRIAQTMDPIVVLVANGLLLASLALFFAAPWLLRFR